MGIAQESGYYIGLQLISLSGVKGIVGRGRQLSQESYSLTGTARQILDNNPQRVTAIISNRSTSANAVTLDFGNNGTTMLLSVGASIQIDNLFPWCGPITGTVAGAATLDVIEVSVP
jgi:hypothetical protein